MKDTLIEWTEHSWSPWIGCTKRSPGCDNCYAEELMDKRMGRVLWGPGNPRSRTSASYWKEPLKWNKAFAENYGPEMLHRPITVFPSLCDWLDPEVPIDWLADFLELISRTPNLRWLLLTKRPELFHIRIDHALPSIKGRTTWAAAWLKGEFPNNVAIGVSAEDQKRWDERVSALLTIPARHRFVSVEPMLGQIDMFMLHARYVGGFGRTHIDQVIFGGESGRNARPCNVDWIRAGVKQCREAGVAAFVKQLGARPLLRPCRQHHFDWRYKTANEHRPDDALFAEDGNYWRVLLTHPKGGDMSEWPEDLRVREEMM